jgi:hypothetical protein
MSLGSLDPAKARPAAPSPARLARYRRIDRRRGLPLPVGVVLAVAVAALGLGIVWVGSGRVGPFVSSMVQGLGGFVATVGQAVSSTPPTAPPAISDAPTIVPPDQPYTNDDAVDVTINVPGPVVGSSAYTVRLWVTLKDQQPKVLSEEAVGPTSVLLLPGVALSPGRNDFQASVVGPGGESALSSVVTWVLDTSKPKLTIISPADGTSVTKDAITVKGKTQAGSSVRLRNDINGATATVDADKNGLFSARLAVAAGMNAILITATDPAGNPNEASITIRKGSGKLTASLTASAYRFRAAKLPRTVSFAVVVDGPDGRPVKGAVALFTVSVPGLQAVVSGEIATGGNGTATFTTSIPSGAMPGSGLATVLVTTDKYGSITDRQVLTVR